MTKECEKEITDYVDSKGFKLNIICPTRRFPLFENGKINRGYYMDSDGGVKNKLEKRYGHHSPSYDGWETLDKWFLEFIDHILIKHKINNIKFSSNNNYTSTTWEFNDIKKLI